MITPQIQNKNTNYYIALFFSQAVLLNIAWNHSYLGEFKLTVESYYSFSTFLIFQYRALPSFVYCILSLGCEIRNFGLNKPIQSTISVFQVLWDFAFLNLAWLAVYNMFFSSSGIFTRAQTYFYSTLIVAWLFIFSFTYVPNRALFYPYDFSDFAFLLTLAALSLKAGAKYDRLACIVMFIGAFNKETVLVFPSVFFILRFAEKNLVAAIKLSFVLAVMGVLGKLSAIGFVNTIMQVPGETAVMVSQLPENFSQLKNPLFYFSFLGVTAYLYLGIIMIRKKLDLIDGCLLAVSALVFVILFKTGISRELRIYTPITALFLIIFARHKNVLFETIKSP